MSKKASTPQPALPPPTPRRAAWPRRIRYASVGVVIAFALWISAHASAKPAGPSPLAPALADAPLPPPEDNGFAFLRTKHLDGPKGSATLSLLSEAETSPWSKLDAKAVESAYQNEKVQEKLSTLDEASIKPDFADDCPYDMPNCSTLTIYAAQQLNMLAAIYITLHAAAQDSDEGAARLATSIRMADKHAATARSLISEMVAMTSLVHALKLAAAYGSSGYKGAPLRDTLASLTLRKADAARVIRQETVFTHNALMAEERALPWRKRMLYAGADTAQAYDDVMRAWLRCFEGGEPPPTAPPNPKAGALWWVWNPVGKSMLSVLDSMSLVGLKLHEAFRDAQAALDEARKLVK